MIRFLKEILFFLDVRTTLMLQIKKAFKASWNWDLIFRLFFIEIIAVAGFLPLLVLEEPSLSVAIIGILIGIVFSLIAYGYLINVSGSYARNKGLPLLKNIPDLFIKGFLAIIITLAYFIVFAVPFALLGYLLYLIMGELSFAIIILLLALPISILFGLFSNSAVIRYAKYEKFSAAFSKEVFTRALTTSFVAAFFIYAGIQIGFNGFFKLIELSSDYYPFAVYLIFFLIFFLIEVPLSVSSFALFGQAYSDKLQKVKRRTR